MGLGNTWDQINRDNVHKLTREAETGMVGRLSATYRIDDSIYLCTAQNIMLALDALPALNAGA